MQIFSFKYKKRLSLIIANAANTLLLPLLNISISLFVIRFTSMDLWGNFVYILIIINLANHILIWGNKDYLLKEFSKAPGRISEKWVSCLKTRLVLIVFFIPVLFIFDLPIVTKTLIFLWVLFSLFYNSFNVLIIYRQKFTFSVILEISVLAVMIATIILFQGFIDIDFLIKVFVISTITKALILSYYFRNELFSWKSAEFDFSILIHALPFFLLGLSGMLQSKIDLYSVAYFLSDKEVGSYQVIINLFIYIQTFSYVILIPFVKNVYRLPLEKVRKISKLLFIIGIVITVPASVLIYLILTILYQIKISLFFLIWSALFALPIFYYLPKIYTLFKNEFQNKVLLINIYGLLSNLLLNIILILKFGMIGAIAASAIAQVIMLSSYIAYERKLYTNEKSLFDKFNNKN